MIVKRARAVFWLESVAEQAIAVRPSPKRLPERGVQATGTEPSRASFAVTEKRTRIRFEPVGARTVLETAPSKRGAVTSNSTPGAVSVPVHVSRALSDRKTFELNRSRPDAFA